MVKVYTSTGKYSPRFDTPELQTKEYSPSWCEYASSKFNQIFKTDVAIDDNNTILYVVPTNFVLFITSAYVTLTTGVNAGGCAIDLLSQSGVDILATRANANSQSSNSQIFPTPFRVASGDSVVLDSFTVGCSSRAGFQGFLVPYSP